ncbi:recombinase family protein [Streptomyces silvisoli]|uniref:Recombinase family protein n=1 Tax=Streptomyces silvisoli TaxID=3034235 RepID=A0ABT5ZLP3_9ACTN|nr:recombinase family protein [Streptomyces silvisoli]MDF3290749.1 recombinase family protein [Streptomyces silvisoli]
MVTVQTPPLAFIYDRSTTTNTAALELRLKACAEYVNAQGWGFGGWWVDKGDQALTDDRRPAFDALLRTLEASGESHPRVCLVHDWTRLSHDSWNRRIFARRIMLAGGWVETTEGETTKPEDARRGLLTGAPEGRTDEPA